MGKHRYKVYFYGTGETATVKSEDLDSYDEKNRGRFNTDRQLKKGDYKEAVDQIESALNGNDPAPLHTDDKSNTTMEEGDSIADGSADESQLQIVEAAPKVAPPPKKPAPIVKQKSEVLLPFTPEPESKENDEKVSRSGRKIKEKKMNLDEMDPDEMFIPIKKRFKNEDSRQKPAVVVLTESNNAIEEFRASKMHILNDPLKRNFLDNQYKLIHVVQDIKLALGLENADVDQSIDLLETFKSDILPHVTNLMLLKYPSVVDTVRRLRKYIGNLSSWGLSETEVGEFLGKAEQIRKLATAVYEKFKVSEEHATQADIAISNFTYFQALFSYPDDFSFWNKFAEEQKSFNDKYNALSPEDLFEGLSFEGSY